MKRVALACIFLFTLNCPFAFSQLARSSSLASMYTEWEKTKSLKLERKFFKEFPTSFEQFQQIYGYDDQRGPAPNYKVSFQHIELFFKTASSVGSSVFTKKLISICSNGKWNADAENFLQENLQNYFLKHSKAVIRELATQSTSTVNGFWFFYLDGPEFKKKIYEHTNRLLVNEPALERSLVNASVLVKKSIKH